MSKKVILASNSPRRKELLKKITDNFLVIPACFEEFSNAEDPRVYVVELAQNKAKEVYSSHKDALVIGCDTVVDFGGSILGKPVDEADAVRMLKELSDNTHFVHTGVCVLCSDEEITFCETTAVTFRKLSEEDIRSYVESGGPMDKAGSYGIQECDFVEKFDGSFDNVVGLPTERLAKTLEKLSKG